MDPLPVLAQMKRGDDDDDGEGGTGPDADDALENLFSKARKWVRHGEGAKPAEVAGHAATRNKEPIA